MSERSDWRSVMGFVAYGAGAAASRALSARAWAAAATTDEVFERTTGAEGFGFGGSGGGALSGSELSHLRKSLVVRGMLLTMTEIRTWEYAVSQKTADGAPGPLGRERRSALKPTWCWNAKNGM